DSALRWRSDRDGDLGTGHSITRANLSAGMHTITLSAINSSNVVGQTSITLTITSTPPTPVPGLQVGPGILDFTYTPGGPNPPTQVLSIRNPGSGSIAWGIQSNAPWVTLSSTNGNGDADVNVGINVAGLPAGFSSSATLTITAPGAAGSPQ